MRLLTMKFYGVVSTILLVACSLCQAFTVTDEIAFTVDGIDIPIKIIQPSEGAGPFPVVYHVHGGGWNGGTETVVPPAAVSPESKFLSDELGIIYVGLAYRCKAQGTFQDGLQDLVQSVKWFEQNAEKYQANVKVYGFSGGSAGTPLGALLANQTQAKTFVGLFGVYDFLNNTESLFPSEEGYIEYGLESDEAKRAASAYHNIRTNPPATILFHGAKDILTHPTQSDRFANKLREQGGDAACIIYPEVNHGYFNPKNPDEYKDSVLKIAALYAKDLLGNPSKIEGLSEKLDKLVKRFYPLEIIDPKDVVGVWKGKNETIDLTVNQSGTITNKKGKKRPVSYSVYSGQIFMLDRGKEISYSMQRNKRAIYKVIVTDERHAGKKRHFNRQ